MKGINLSGKSIDDTAIEVAMLQRTGQAQLENYMREMVRGINQKLLSSVDQKLLFRVSGSHEKTLTYGPRQNRTTLISFDKTFVGIVGESGLSDANKLGVNILYNSKNQFCIDCKELKLLESGNYHLNEFTDPLYLINYQKEGPSWTLLDLVKQHVSESAIENFLGERYKSKVRCALEIGDQEYYDYWQSGNDTVTNFARLSFKDTKFAF